MDLLLNIIVFVAILGFSALITQRFARWMYIACQGCGALNARRRTHCRHCGQLLHPGIGGR